LPKESSSVINEFKPKWAKPKSTKDKPVLTEVVEEEDEWELVGKDEKPIKKKFRRNIKRDFYPEAFLNDLKKNDVVKKEQDKVENDEKEQVQDKIEDTSAQEKIEEVTQEIAQETTENTAEVEQENEREKPNSAEDEILVQRDTAESNNSEEDSESDSCDDEWITPDNLNSYLHSTETSKTQPEEELDDSRNVTVEVVTSDFAMQNVLMQIGIPTISLDGVEIRHIKTFKLLCEGCKTVNKKVDVEFCEKCGGHTLRKVSVFSNSNGEITFFKGKRLKKNNRGVQFSIPKPKGGRENTAMILREDQLWVGKLAHNRSC
jgi:RNA-binding protein NOB1